MLFLWRDFCFSSIWEGLGRILGGFGEDLGMAWDDLGEVWEGFFSNASLAFFACFVAWICSYEDEKNPSSYETP